MQKLPASPRRLWRGLLLPVLASAGLLFSVGQAFALPSYATQTGAPCSACHVGGFGPELTGFGRSFKLGGYTMGKSRDLLSAMAILSAVNTAKSQPGAVAPHYRDNNNVSLDEASVFVAGKLTEHVGVFGQLTYDGIGRKFSWDGLDARYARPVKIGDSKGVFGVSVNNSPGIEDPWNSLSGWSFPYTASDLGPSPAAAPLSAGGLEHNVLGVTPYLWLNDRVYIAGGLYGGISDGLLKTVGMDGESANLKGPAWYARGAYQKGALEVGGFGLLAETYPGGDKSTGQADHYRDLGVDASYQLMTRGRNVLTLNGRYTLERQTLDASFLLGDAASRKLTLNDLRANVSYYWNGRFGASAGLFDTWGGSDALLYSANTALKPDSTGATLQFDFTPWPTGKTPFSARSGARFGVQYTAYDKFDGSKTNYDGSGRNASDNNTLRAFAWLSF